MPMSSAVRVRMSTRYLPDRSSSASIFRVLREVNPVDLKLACGEIEDARLFVLG